MNSSPRCPVHICAAMTPAGLCAIANKSSPEHQAQIKWAREIVSNVVIPTEHDAGAEQCKCPEGFCVNEMGEMGIGAGHQVTNCRKTNAGAEPR